MEYAWSGTVLTKRTPPDSVKDATKEDEHESR